MKVNTKRPCALCGILMFTNKTAQHQRAPHTQQCEFCGAMCRAGVMPNDGYNYAYHLWELHGVRVEPEIPYAATVEARAALRGWSMEERTSICNQARQIVREAERAMYQTGGCYDTDVPPLLALDRRRA